MNAVQLVFSDVQFDIDAFVQCMLIGERGGERRGQGSTRGGEGEREEKYLLIIISMEQSFQTERLL